MAMSMSFLFFKNNFKKAVRGFLVIAYILASAPLPAFAIIYQPGETLNPACVPTDLNCGIATSTAGNFVPDANNVYDIGSPTRQWRDLYLSGNTLHLGGLSLSAGTSGALVWSGTSIETAPSATSTSILKLSELSANGSEYVGLKAPDAIASSTLWTLPASDGSSGQALSTDGNGTLLWITPLASAVVTLNGLSTSSQTFSTSATGTDFGIISSGSTHTFNMPSASATARGLLTSADWTSFNNKLSAILASGNVFVGSASDTAMSVALSGDATLSNTGSLTIGSGAVTLAKLAADAVNSAKIVDGSVALVDLASNSVDASKITDATITNADVAAAAAIAYAKLALGNSIVLSDLTLDSVNSSKVVDGSITNADLASSTIGLLLGTSGADANVSGSPASLGGSLTLNLPSASGVARGLLTAADWATFNNKESAVATGTAAQYYRGDKAWTALDTSVVPENGNVYYTSARFNADLASKTTANLAEGSNLYYTDARARNALAVSSPLSYSTSTGTFSISQVSSSASGYLSSVDWNTFNNKLDATLSSGLVWVGNGLNVATPIAISGDAAINNAGTLTISDGVITLSKLAADAVNSAKVVDGSIALADLAGNSVDTAKIVDATITNADISITAAIVYSKLNLGNSIVIADLTADSVNSSKIIDGSVVAADLATDSVVSSKVLDGTLTDADISAIAAIALSKLASGTSGNIIVANASGTPVYIALTGDATINNAGALTIANLAITNAKLADDAVTTVKILDSNVTTAKLADAAVTLAKLAVDSVDSSKIVDGTIVNADIATGTITNAKLANSSFATVLGTTGTDANISGSPISLGGTLTLNLPDASAIARGLVTTGAQTFAGAKTFSSAPAFSTMTNGSVLFTDTGGLLSQDNTSLFWDNTNKRLGIGDGTPLAMFTVGSGDLFQVNDSGNIAAIGGAAHTIGNSGGALNIDSSGTGAINLGTSANGKTVTIGNITSGTTIALNAGNTSTGNINFDSGTLYVDSVNNRVGVGTTTPSSKLALNGGVFSHTPDAPQFLAGLELATAINKIVVVGKYLYSVHNNGASGNEFNIIDISNPSTPSVRGGLNYTPEVRALAVSGKYAYIGLSANTGGTEFRIIDISNPSSPVELGGTEHGDNVYTIAISGRYAFVGHNAGTNEFDVVDISNPLSPQIVAGIDLGGTGMSAYSIKIQGRYAYVGGGTATTNFWVIDISNPLAPSIVSSVDLQDTVLSVDVRGRYAYVGFASNATRDFGIVDISSPAATFLVGSLEIDNNNTNEVVAAGKYVYVARDSTTGSGELFVIDVANSSTPTIVASVEVGLSVNALAVSGKYALIGKVTNGGTELDIYSVSGIESPAANIGSLAVDNFSSDGDGVAANNFTVGGGLNVGSRGIMTDGALSVHGTSTSFFAGNVGIGVTGPSYRLELPNNVDASGQGRANAWVTYSDESLKDKALTLKGGLEKVMNLRGVSFIWKNSGIESSGFIAQEVERVVPDLVSTGSDGLKSLDYARFAPYIVSAIQEIASLGSAFKDTLVAWFADAANGITDFFAKKIHTEQICLKKSDGSEYCVNGDELEAVMSGRGEVVPAQPAPPEQNLSDSNSNEAISEATDFMAEQASTTTATATDSSHTIETEQSSITIENLELSSSMEAQSQEPILAPEMVSMETDHEELVPSEASQNPDTLEQKVIESAGAAEDEAVMAPVEPSGEDLDTLQTNE